MALGGDLVALEARLRERAGADVFAPPSNVEIGVRHGSAAAAQARKIFSYLIESRVHEEASC